MVGEPIETAEASVPVPELVLARGGVSCNSRHRPGQKTFRWKRTATRARRRFPVRRDFIPQVITVGDRDDLNRCVSKHGLLEPVRGCLSDSHQWLHDLPARHGIEPGAHPNVQETCRSEGIRYFMPSQTKGLGVFGIQLPIPLNERASRAQQRDESSGRHTVVVQKGTYRRTNDHVEGRAEHIEP